MTKQTEAMKLALEALETIRQPLRINTSLDAYDVGRAITALRRALEQQDHSEQNLNMVEQPATATEAHEQEPAGWRPATFHRDNLTFTPGLPDEQTVKFWKLQGVEIEYCYTSPPQLKPLTDEQMADFLGCRYHTMSQSDLEFFRLGEAAHGIGEKK